MPIKAISSDTTKIIIDLGQGPLELTYLGLPGQSGSNNHRNALMEGIQALLETRINVDELPLDEETIDFSDAEMIAQFGEAMFYEKVGPNTFLVSRTAIVDIDKTVWDGEKYQIALRRPDRTRAPT